MSQNEENNISLRQRIKIEVLSDESLVKPQFICTKTNNLNYLLINGITTYYVHFEKTSSFNLDDKFFFLKNSVEYSIKTNLDNYGYLIFVIDDFIRNNECDIIKHDVENDTFRIKLKSVFYEKLFILDEFLVNKKTSYINEITMIVNIMQNKRISFDQAMNFIKYPHLKKYRLKNRKDRKLFINEQYERVKYKQYHLFNLVKNE